MILRISNVIATLLAAAASQPSFALAFQSPSQAQRHSIQALHARPFTHAAREERALTFLQMSSIPNPSDENDSGFFPNLLNDFDLQKIFTKLPPLPEDGIALGGDVLSLFVYTYLDHTVNELYADTAAKMDVADLVSYDPTLGGPSIPVWFDATHLQSFGQNWLSHANVEVPYAPLIAASGLAFVTMSTCWLLCGYLTGAFLSSKTVECDTESAMVVTLQTWSGMALLMVLLALGSDALWGQLDEINALSAPARGGLTNADADYIFDSLTVLAFWRFMYSWLLGYR